jgi:hypothetical protein
MKRDRFEWFCWYALSAIVAAGFIMLLIYVMIDERKAIGCYVPSVASPVLYKPSSIHSVASVSGTPPPAAATVSIS